MMDRRSWPMPSAGPSSAATIILHRQLRRRKALRMPQMTQWASSIAGLRLMALSLFALSAGACASDTLEPSTGAEMGADTPEVLASDSLAADTLAADSLSLETAFFASASANRRGTPFGFWRLEYSQLGSDWTSLQGGASPATIRSKLEMARKRGARVFAQFAGSTKHYQNKNGSFSIEKFKAQLARFKRLNLDSYIADGTLAGHMMIDEPSDASNWHGHAMTHKQVEEAAKASKAVWPKLPALVRTVPSWLAKSRWTYLDGAWAQYSSRKGNVTSYRDAESRAASKAGLKVVWGLNVLDGGDGSSRKRGTARGKYTMSASELQKYGRALLGASNTCGFLMWMYHTPYVKDRAVLSSLKSLSSYAKSRPAQSCKS
jgi:hypothetical protein